MINKNICAIIYLERIFGGRRVMNNDNQLKILLQSMTNEEKDELYILLKSISFLKSQTKYNQEQISFPHPKELRTY